MKLLKTAGRAFDFLLLATVFLALLFGNVWQSQAMKIKGHIPAKYVSTYQAAGQAYDVDWYLLAAIHRVETNFSQSKSMVSNAGALGPMQFLPLTWVGWNYPGKNDDVTAADLVNLDVIAKYGGYGIDGDKDGKADPMNLSDAVFSTANYLDKTKASVDRKHLKKAIFDYNHSDIYVTDILYYYDLYKKLAQN
ncbi:lytic transglycosylase domain-containing protein [Brochothrix campestris]|uniref:Transglycosylase SLT domain-containing protein n=1 Tax=Brochothrix campestris FSL F6-1037 TaxID=1265861 RepID=W7CNP1_9LIST|nr:lytic transglycosylase domain-containing protein [Brochothrix campestris]EUJ41159.1 hypothetical protein BCAMP_04065 [Brochothrix campestris FSL F6-1037]